MTSKFKPGDEVWVKGVVLPSSAKGNCVFVEVVDITGEDAAIPLHCSKLRPRVKRKPPASPWQPIEGAPKDGTPVLLRRVNAKGVECFYVAWHFMGEWTTGMHTVFDPTHYMLIPQLEGVLRDRALAGHDDTAQKKFRGTFREETKP